LNIASAPPSDFPWLELPLLAVPEALGVALLLLELELPEPELLGVALALPELPLDALSSAAWAARGTANAAAMAAAMRVFTFMRVSS
jgi:hypothetical protein